MLTLKNLARKGLRYKSQYPWKYVHGYQFIVFYHGLVPVSFTHIIHQYFLATERNYWTKMWHKYRQNSSNKSLIIYCSVMS